MKRKAGALMLLAALGGGCMSMDKAGPSMKQMGGQGASARARPAAGLQGPFGEPVATAAPAQPAMRTAAATHADQQSDIVQAGWKAKKGQAMDAPPPGAVAALGSLPGIPAGVGPAQMAGRTSIRFISPAGMKVAWFAPQAPGSNNGFTPAQVEVPGRYNFVQGGVYRLKLTEIPNRPALELYPTLEVKAANFRTSTFLAHSAVPVAFTEEDFEQVAAGNFVIKVVYLPDPQFQDLAVAGPDEIVSTRLEPGVDPILEAERRGSVLLVIRMGNIDLEAPNTPAMNAPPSNMPFQGMPLMAPPGGMMPGQMPPQMPGQMPPPPPLPAGLAPNAAGRPMMSQPTTKMPDQPKTVTTISNTSATGGLINRMKQN